MISPTVEQALRIKVQKLSFSGKPHKANRWHTSRQGSTESVRAKSIAEASQPCKQMESSKVPLGDILFQVTLEINSF